MKESHRVYNDLGCLRRDLVELGFNCSEIVNHGISFNDVTNLEFKDADFNIDESTLSEVTCVPAIELVNRFNHKILLHCYFDDSNFLSFTFLTKTVAIIYHRADMDGICSGIIAGLYETENHRDYIVLPIGYDHVDNVEDVVAKIENTINLECIYMLDLTLSESFLEKYAKYIYYIDHHDKGLAVAAPYKDKFLKYYYDITGIVDCNGKPAKKAAACELTWKALYGNKHMPIVVKLCGRYDVWDHDVNNSTIGFNEYCKSYGIDKMEIHDGYVLNEDDDTLAFNGTDPNSAGQYFLHVFLNSICIDNIREYEDSWLYRSISRGLESHKHKVRIDEEDVKKTGAICKFVGTDIKVIVANKANRNSIFFNSVSKNSGCCCSIVFYYDLEKSVWKASMYTIDGPFNMQQIFDILLANKNNKIVDHGGHILSACGFVSMDIQEDLLKHLEFIKRF